MIFETVITSVPRGLKAGRSGSQPVMRTRGLRDDLLNQLSPLAGYRHVHRQGSGQNPVIFSYRRLSSNIGDLAVIGRTVDAGSDFSNRSNKCGHLIAFTADEIGRLSRTTPAAILTGNTSLFADQWIRGPEERPAPPALAEPPQEPAVCALWQQQFGDAGWAGLVAERARRRQPTMLLAPDCTPQSSELLLGLILEATALLPPGERWAVSFETTVLGSSDSLIQGTYRGSTEAEAPRPGMLVLPLGGPLPQTPLEETALCKLARFGKPRPATPPPPSVTGASSAPPGGDDFLGGDVPSTAPGSPPPLQRPTQGRDRTPFEPVPHDAGQPKSHHGMIAGGLTIVLLALFLVGYAFVANLEHFWPEKPTEQAGQKAATKQSPREVLNAYLAATHAKEPPADLPEPSTAVWREWLESMEVKDSIDEKWRSFANAVLRKCIRPEPNPFDTEWKQKERAFLEAVKNLSNLKPKIADFYFLLLCPPPKISNKDDALRQQTASFIKAALDAHGRDRRDGKQIKPDDVIENALNAAAFYRDLTTFLETATDEESSPTPKASELASRWPSIPGLPPVTSKQETADLQKHRREFFLKSLLPSIQDGGKDSPHFTYKILVERANAFKNALERLVQYATPNTPNPKTPTLDDYVTVYGDPSPHTVEELNAALQSLQKAPKNLNDILSQANFRAAWQTLKKSFGATLNDNGELKIVLAKGIQHSEAIHKFIEPAFATRHAAITKGPNLWTVTVNQERCCTIKWDSDKTTLVADFADRPPARALQSIPLVIHRKENGETVDTTPPFRIRKRAIQYALQPDQAQQTVGSLADSGGRTFAQIQQSDVNVSTKIADVFSIVDPKTINFKTTLSRTGQKTHDLDVTKTPRNEGTVQATYKVPEDTGRQQLESHGPDDEIIASVKYSFDSGYDRLSFSVTGSALPKAKLTSTARALKTNTVTENTFTDIAHAAYVSSEGADADLKPADLQKILLKITNQHAFGIRKDLFGQTPLYGEDNGSPEKSFQKNNFESNDFKLIYRPLLGVSDAASLDKRSWEMTLASYLVKNSKVFVDKTKSFEAAEEELKTTEETLARLKENEKENKEEIEEKEKEKRKQNRAKNEITDWFQGGWAKEDLPKIAENVRKQALKEETAEGRRKLVAAQIYLNLRPFLGRYLLANDEEVKDIPLTSLLRTEIAYEPPPGFGEKFSIAVIEPAAESDSAPPGDAGDEPTSQAP